MYDVRVLKLMGWTFCWTTKFFIICSFTAGCQIYNLLSQPQFCRVRESNLLFSCCLLQFYKGATAGVRSVCKKLAKLWLVYLELRVIFDGFKKTAQGCKVAFLEENKIIIKKQWRQQDTLISYNFDGLDIRTGGQ